MRHKLLAIQAAQGDRSALESLVRQYYDAIYNYIFQRVRSRETAEDLTQDVFVKLTACISSYRPLASFSAFLYRIAHNQVIDYYRTCRTAVPLKDSRPEEAASENSFSVPLSESARRLQDPAHHTEEKLLVEAMLSRLTPEQRECILLYYFHGLTCREISLVLDAPVPTVKSRVRRGLKSCRKWLEEE
ncbi:MAG TPA: RNA polymerase sigma factor [Candidatus Mediterraneibacter cottocaccae]|nr:RNA polymerase sigma factor [Candidatus Mediterraneibacter cottocaccae]